MRKFFLSLASSFFALSLFALPVFALNTDNGTKIRQRDEDRVNQNVIENQDARVENRARIEDKKATQEAKTKLTKQERIRSHWGILEKRITATIERIEILISRIESRLVKIAVDNPELNLTLIQSQLDETKILLADVKLDSEEASLSIEELLISQNPQDDFEELRDKIKDIKDALVEIHRILVLLIGDIKGLRVGSFTQSPTVAASPTPTVAASPPLSPG